MRLDDLMLTVIYVCTLIVCVTAVKCGRLWKGRHPLPGDAPTVAAAPSTLPDEGLPR